MSNDSSLGMERRQLFVYDLLGCCARLLQLAAHQPLRSRRVFAPGPRLERSHRSPIGLICRLKMIARALTSANRPAQPCAHSSLSASSRRLGHWKGAACPQLRSSRQHRPSVAERRHRGTGGRAVMAAAGASAGEGGKTRVLMVCLGNICRSPTAGE